jgi:hypothetical protein
VPVEFLAKPQSREGDDDALLDESMTTDIIEACNTLLR